MFGKFFAKTPARQWKIVSTWRTRWGVSEAGEVASRSGSGYVNMYSLRPGDTLSVQVGGIDTIVLENAGNSVIVLGQVK